MALITTQARKGGSLQRVGYTHKTGCNQCGAEMLWVFRARDDYDAAARVVAEFNKRPHRCRTTSS